MLKADAMSDSAPHSRMFVYGAAFLAAGLIFAVWYFVLPHRVPIETRADLPTPPETLKAETDQILDRTKTAQAELKQREAQWRAEDEARKTEEERRQADIDASRAQLESQGFRTTSPSTDVPKTE